MTLTIGLTQLKRKKREDGTIPIYIRITENRKSRYRSTGIAVKKKHFLNNAGKIISSSHRRSQHLDVKLKRQLNEIEEIRRQLYKQDKLSMAAIFNELEEDIDTGSILHQAKAYKRHLKENDQYWEQRHFTVVINNLTSFINDTNSSDRLDQLDSGWITAFQTYLLKEVGNGNNTVRKKLQRLKGMTDWLLKNKEIENNPFARVDRVEKTKTNSKVKLSFDQIKAIENLNLERGSALWHVRNYFMFSFYNAGIRFGDLCCLRWGNLIDGRLVYKMNKTDQQKSINQLQPMYRILINYAHNPGAYLTFTAKGFNYPSRPIDPLEVLTAVVKAYASDNSDQYIFPILDKDFNDPNELRKRISSNNVIVNRHLKTLAGKAKIQANISFHVSRHSFAHYALKKGMDVYSISKALGHSDLKITQAYLKSFDEDMLDKSMNKLF